MTESSRWREELARQTMTSARLSRRDLGRFALAAGIGLGIGNELFVAARADTPKRGGTFRMGIGAGSTTDSLDPGTWNNQFTAPFGQAFFGACLTEIDQKNLVQPNLAESFEPADRAARWIFKLRKGLTFHNGKSVTPADVVATYNFHLDKSSKSAAKGVISGISEVKSDGTETVIFILKSGNADFPYLVSDYHLPIYPAKDGGGIDWEKGMGAGPFILESFQPGVQATAKRNPNYHKTGKPYFDVVKLLAILDDAARNNALLSGDIDYSDRPDPKMLDLLKKNPEIVIDSVTGTYQYHALMNVTVAPFDNVDVRSALKYAIDREEIVQKIQRGYGKAGNDNPIARKTKFAIEPEPIHKYDPDRVKFHLKKAGLQTLKVDFSTSDAAFSGAVDASLLMQAKAAKAGIDINVIRESSDGYWDNVWMHKPFCMSYWGGRPTCDYAFSTLYTDDATWNDTSWKNPRFNELVRTARAETDDAKRQALYAEAQQIIHDDGGLILLLFSDNVLARSKKLAHGELNSNFPNDGALLFERWWFV
jgi:peptide/nickel transport system substrate-binding protein